jgi:Flp pilus assembly protein TadB
MSFFKLNIDREKERLPEWNVSVSDVELVAVFVLALSLIVIGWNPTVYTSQSRETRSIQSTPELVQLIALVDVSANFNEAYAKWKSSDRVLDDEIARRLEQVRRLSLTYGVSAGTLVTQLEQVHKLQQSLRTQWDELSSGAKATSKLLTFLPIATHVISYSIGIEATAWMFSNPFGFGLIALALILTLISQKIQKLNPFSAIKVTTLSSRTASTLTLIGVVIWQPSVQGLVLAVVLSLLVKDAWHRLVNESANNRLRSQKFKLTWELTVLATALQAGLSWNEALKLVVNEVDDDAKRELEEVLHRIEQGASAKEAFSRSVLWSDIATSLTYAQADGSKVVPVLNSLKETTIRMERNFQEIRLRKRAQLLTVAVTALQLPAFFAVGLVPIAAEPITELLSQFSSTVAIR